MGGFAQKFNDAQANPLFMGGLGLLQSGDVSGLLQGSQMAAQIQAEREAQARQQQVQSQIQKILSQSPQVPGATPPFVPPGLAGTAGVAPGALSAPPQQVQAPASQMAQIAQVLATSSDPQLQRAGLQQLFNSANFERNNARDDSEFERNLAAEEAAARQRLADQKELELLRQQGRVNNAQDPSSVREFNFFNDLSPEQQEQFMNLKRGEEGPSSKTEGVLYDATDAAVKARANVAKYNDLAQRMTEIDPASGFLGSTSETLKAMLGVQDAATLVRKDYVKLRNSAAVQDLPPGVASDKDIQLVLSGFLPENADPQMISQYMRGLAKVEDLNAQYSEFKADYIASDPGRGAIGLSQAWRDRATQMFPQQPRGPSGAGLDLSSLSTEELERMLRAQGG